jgi:hypothetical protein
MDRSASAQSRSSSIMINKAELELLLRNLGLKGAYCHDDDSHSCPDTQGSNGTSSEASEMQSTCTTHERVRRTESTESVRPTPSRKNSGRFLFPTLERLPTVMQQTEAKLFPERRSRTNTNTCPLLRVTTPTDDFLVRLDARQDKLLKQSSTDVPIELKNITTSFGRGLLDEYDPTIRSRAATNPEKMRQKRQPQDTVFDIISDGQHLPVLNGRSRVRSYTTKREATESSLLTESSFPIRLPSNDSERSLESLFSSSVDDDRLRNLKLD